MKQYRGKWVAAVVVLLALAAAAFGLFSRSPALVVTDVPFTALYGTRRTLLRQLRASAALLRPVRPVIIAEGAGPDVQVFAIEDAAARSLSRRPYCVLFPYRYAEGARRYREQFPGVPVALLEGRSGPGDGAFDAEGSSTGLFVFGADSERDLYRAGLCAAILGGSASGTIPVFQDPLTQTAGQSAFIKGLREQGNGIEPLFVSGVADLAENEDISCAVLIGSGAEYFDQGIQAPVILFSWLDPELAARDTALVFDDSPWAQAVPAVKMIARNQTGGRLPADILIFPAKIADKDILRRLKKAVRDSG
jgi:hypothetical protein